MGNNRTPALSKRPCPEDHVDKINAPAASIENGNDATRLLIYPPGHPEATQRCCNGKAASVVRVPVQDGRFCIGQSQAQMKWTLRAQPSGLALGSKVVASIGWKG